MRTFGRVLAGLGLALAGIGGIGAVALLPPPVLDSVGDRIEDRRQALRAHLPEMPDLSGLLAGTAAPGCADAGPAETAFGRSAAAGTAPGATACDGDGVGVFRGVVPAPLVRPIERGARIRAPAADGAAAAD